MTEVPRHRQVAADEFRRYYALDERYGSAWMGPLEVKDVDEHQANGLVALHTPQGKVFVSPETTIELR